MKFKHEELDVWRNSKDLVGVIYSATCKFPKSESFNLVSQINRSVVSVPLNIAEGCARYSKDDFAKFLRISIGSLLETDCSLQISQDLGYINPEHYEEIRKDIQEIYFKLIKLEKSLKSRKRDFQQVQHIQQDYHEVYS